MMPAVYIRNPFTLERQRIPLMIGTDPGAEKGYALIDPEDEIARKSIVAPRVLAVGTKIDAVRAALSKEHICRRNVWAVVEFQYGERVATGEISGTSIIKLGFRAGYMIAQLRYGLPNVVEVFATVPKQWKPRIFPGGDRLRKDIFCETVKRQLLPKELELFADVEAKNVDDVLDGIGLAWALAHAVKRSAPVLRDWRVTEDRIIPLDSRRWGSKLKPPNI